MPERSRNRHPPLRVLHVAFSWKVKSSPQPRAFSPRPRSRRTADVPAHPIVGVQAHSIPFFLRPWGILLKNQCNDPLFSFRPTHRTMRCLIVKPCSPRTATKRVTQEDCGFLSIRAPNHPRIFGGRAGIVIGGIQVIRSTFSADRDASQSTEQIGMTREADRSAPVWGTKLHQFTCIEEGIQKHEGRANNDCHTS